MTPGVIDTLRTLALRAYAAHRSQRIPVLAGGQRVEGGTDHGMQNATGYSGASGPTTVAVDDIEYEALLAAVLALVPKDQIAPVRPLEARLDRSGRVCAVAIGSRWHPCRVQAATVAAEALTNGHADGSAFKSAGALREGIRRLAQWIRDTGDDAALLARVERLKVDQHRQVMERA